MIQSSRSPPLPRDVVLLHAAARSGVRTGTANPHFVHPAVQFPPARCTLVHQRARRGLVPISSSQEMTRPPRPGLYYSDNACRKTTLTVCLRLGQTAISSLENR